MIPCKPAPLLLALTAIIATALSAVPSVRDGQAVLRNPLENGGAITPNVTVLYWFNNNDTSCTGPGTRLELGDDCSPLPSHVVKLNSTKCKEVVVAIDRCVGNPIILLEGECVNAEFHDTVFSQGCPPL